MRVREVEPVADVDRQIQLVRQAHPVVARHAPLEVLALEVFHGEVGHGVVLAQVVNGDDVAV